MCVHDELRLIPPLKDDTQVAYTLDDKPAFCNFGVADSQNCSGFSSPVRAAGNFVNFSVREQTPETSPSRKLVVSHHQQVDYLCLIRTCRLHSRYFAEKLPNTSESFGSVSSMIGAPSCRTWVSSFPICLLCAINCDTYS